jgi:hypothetical protein
MITRTIEIYETADKIPDDREFVIAYYAPAEEWCLAYYDHKLSIWSDGEGPDMDLEEITHWFAQPDAR